MPRARRPRKGRRRSKRRADPPGMVSQVLPPVESKLDLDLPKILHAFTPKEEKKETKEGWVILRQAPPPQLRLLRSLFKADHPYRTRLGIYAGLNTNASGVLNSTTNLTSISSTAEWSSIDALFDELFVHAMHITYQPYNPRGGGGAGASGTTAVSAVSGVSNTSNCTSVTSGGLVISALFNGAGAYTTAQSQLSNPTTVIRSSVDTWRYAWRNNVRFDPRGPASSSTNWAGWCLVSNVSNLAGTIQVRAANDAAMGDLTHVWMLGTMAVVYDVSFRARA